MPERGPRPRPEEMRRREKIETKTDAEPKRSPVKRKLALAATLIAGAGALYEKVAEPNFSHTSPQENRDHHQEISPEQQREIDAVRNKLVLAAKLLKELPPPSEVSQDEGEDTAKEDWFELHTALQNAEIDLERARMKRSRDNEYGSLQERLSQHPEAMAMFDENFKRVKVEHTEDGVYAHLDGENGFELVVTVDVDPTTQEPILSIAGSTATDTYTHPVHMDEGFKNVVQDIDSFVNMKVENQIENLVLDITQADIKAKYPDYAEPRWEAPSLDEPEEDEEEAD